MSRLNGIFLDVIGVSQTTFVLGGKILDAILLTQELIYNYHLVSHIPKCALKIDIKKVFDTVSW